LSDYQHINKKHACRTYSDRSGNLVEAIFFIKNNIVTAVHRGIYERQYTQKEWQEKVRCDELYELESRTRIITMTIDSRTSGHREIEHNEKIIVPSWLLRKKERIIVPMSF
jgi:hypothetical protein